MSCLFLGVLCAKGGVGLKTDGVDTDESIGISGVVVKGITSSLNIHRGKVGVVERLDTFTSTDGHVTLVEFNLDETLNITLGEVERVADQFHLGCEPETVVAQTGEFRGQALGDALDFTVHGDSLQVHVCGAEKSSSRCLVDTTTLDSNESVLDNVDTPNTVSSGNLVAVKEEFERLFDDGSVGNVGDLDRDTLEELDADNFRSFRGGLGGDSHLEHGFIRRAHGVFEHTTFVGCVEHVLVDGVVGLGLGIDGDFVLCAVSEQVLASLEGLNELGIAPRGNALDSRRKSLSAHFEADLVVSLTGGSVRNVRGTFFDGDADHLLGDARTGNGGTEKVSSLVDGVGLDGFKDIVVDVVLAEVRDDTLGGTAIEGLGLDGSEVFFELSDVGTEGNHFKALLIQPFEDDGGIETSRVGEDELGFDTFGHDAG
jgi:hypothetical protein